MACLTGSLRVVTEWATRRRKDDRCLKLDTNIVERAMRLVVLAEKMRCLPVLQWCATLSGRRHVDPVGHGE